MYIDHTATMTSDLNVGLTNLTRELGRRVLNLSDGLRERVLLGERDTARYLAHSVHLTRDAKLHRQSKIICIHHDNRIK